MTTWYQVYTKTGCYGFKADAIKILDHPDRSYIGMTLSQFKTYLPNLGITQIYKIADICE